MRLPFPEARAAPVGHRRGVYGGDAGSANAGDRPIRSGAEDACWISARNRHRSERARRRASSLARQSVVVGIVAWPVSGMTRYRGRKTGSAGDMAADKRGKMLQRRHQRPLCVEGETQQRATMPGAASARHCALRESRRMNIARSWRRVRERNASPQGREFRLGLRTFERALTILPRSLSPTLRSDLASDCHGTAWRGSAPPNIERSGGPGGTRTRDLSIKSRLLYRLSYGPISAAGAGPRGRQGLPKILAKKQAQNPPPVGRCHRSWLGNASHTKPKALPS